MMIALVAAAGSIILASLNGTTGIEVAPDGSSVSLKGEQILAPSTTISDIRLASVSIPHDRCSR
jgi:hypothetical protein